MRKKWKTLQIIFKIKKPLISQRLWLLEEDLFVCWFAKKLIFQAFVWIFPKMKDAPDFSAGYFRNNGRQPYAPGYIENICDIWCRGFCLIF